jgi:hypothetical protein
VEKFTYLPAPGSPDAQDDANASGPGKAPLPIVHNTGVTDFGTTFPNRIHAFLEDVTNKVPKDRIRAAGRDALATLEYTFAAIHSYENGGIVVQPHPLPSPWRPSGVDK